MALSVAVAAPQLGSPTAVDALHPISDQPGLVRLLCLLAQPHPLGLLCIIYFPRTRDVFHVV